MRRELEARLQASLTECLREWWANLDDESLREFHAYTGDETFDWMATAAIAVLADIQDSQEYMAAEGLLKEE